MHAFYKAFLNPQLGFACKFHPSCSEYAKEAIQKRGFVMGSLLATWRVLRCQPFTEGGLDPVPEQKRICCGRK